MQHSDQAKQTKTRGRPASFCREDLITKVTDLFWERGYHNLSLNEIAHETGLTRASLYNAFETKEALFLECIEHYFANSPGAILKTHKIGDKAAPLFYEMFDQICTIRAEDKKNRGCLVVNMASEFTAKDKNLKAALLDIQTQRKESIANLIKQATNQNELPKNTAPEVTANIILAFMSGLSTFSKTGADKKTLLSMCHTFLTQMGFTNNMIFSEK